MIRVTLMDGSLQEIRREEAQGLYPVDGLLRHPLLKADGIICLKGKVIPVTGPFPENLSHTGPVEERPWLLFYGDRAQLVRGLPQFDDDIALTRSSPTVVVAAAPEITEPFDSEEAKLLQEMEDLLRSA